MVGARRAADALEIKEAALWTLVWAGDGTHPRIIPEDCNERLHKIDKGLFAPPSWPAALPINQHAADEDKSWRELQAKWGINGLTVVWSLVGLEATVPAALSSVGCGPQHTHQTLLSPRGD